MNTPSAYNSRGPGVPNRPISSKNVKLLPKNSTIGFTNKQNKVQHVFNVDSRARDLNKYIDPNNYRFRLKRPLKNVVKLELVTAEIPHSDFVVNEYNNKIDLIDNGSSETVTIPIGDYDCNELANEIATQLNTLTNGSTFTVSFANGKYTINSDQTFSLLFSSGTNADKIVTSKEGYNIGTLEEGTSLRRVIGFEIADTTSGTSATGTNKINLGGENYVILELGPDVRENLDYFDSSGNSAFGKIVFPTDLNVVQYYSESEYDVSRTYKNPIPKLEFLNVSFKTYGGRVYNFRGHEHSFLIRATTEE